MKPVCFKVSVIITTCNRSIDILNRAVNSVLKQTYQNFELIIVNDAPQNNELKMQLKSYVKTLNQDRVRYVCLKKNMGACFARNIGINLARGVYIAFLDDDDEWLQNKLEKQVGCIEADKNIGLVYCNNYVKNKSGKSMIQKRKKVSTKEELLVQNYIGSASFPLITKRCFSVCGGFREGLQSCQDWDMWMRIVSKFTISFCEEPLVIYHISNEGITANVLKQVRGWNQFLRIYKKEYKIYNQYLDACLDYIIEVLLYKGENFYAFIYQARKYWMKKQIK